MAKIKNKFEFKTLISKATDFKGSVVPKIRDHKKLAVTILIVAVLIFIYNGLSRKSTTTNIVRSANLKIGKSFDFAALNNSGKPAGSKIKFTISSAEKTNQVLVNDKVFTAKNNKMFLILNLELKNDATTLLNILPGDLIRLYINGDEENKFAPDLHNNLVPVSAISTKLDRVGFVIPDSAKSFKIFVGELEGKKESIDMSFPS